MTERIQVVVARGAGLLCLWLVISRPDLPDFLVGAATAAATWASLCLLPPGTGRLRPAALVRLGLRFVWQSAVAGADVRAPRARPEPAVATRFCALSDAPRAGCSARP
jgi:multicomponent Na+:H+ antiporter subunit E